jgi:hypothetical protein
MPHNVKMIPSFPMSLVSFKKDLNLKGPQNSRPLKFQVKMNTLHCLLHASHPFITLGFLFRSRYKQLQEQALRFIQRTILSHIFQAILVHPQV